MLEQELIYRIRKLIKRVYQNLGPGLLKEVYEHALIYETTQEGLHSDYHKIIPITYRDVNLDTGFRIDLLIENRLIVEVLAQNEIRTMDHKKMQTYLSLSNLSYGILVNFHTERIAKSVVIKTIRKSVNKL